MCYKGIVTKNYDFCGDVWWFEIFKITNLNIEIVKQNQLAAKQEYIEKLVTLYQVLGGGSEIVDKKK